jgi:NAD(P)-dependent dehydrogenase (short-subunit alcohol dehydrogenase family)
MRIEGSAALVTGAASGLGAATARALAGAGAKVVIADVTEQAGERLAGELGARFARTDVTKSEDVIAAVELARGLAPLRIVVSCAGILHVGRTIGRDGSYESACPLDRFERTIAVNLVGTFNVARLAASAMSRNEPLEDGERGVIVNTASVAAFDGQIGQVAYSASKGGIVGMNLPLARDLAVVGIRVNTIAPGMIDTPIYEQAGASDELRARLSGDVLFPHRFGRPEEYASLVLELVRNSYLNAEVVRLDAGARLPPR